MAEEPNNEVEAEVEEEVTHEVIPEDMALFYEVIVASYYRSYSEDLIDGYRKMHGGNVQTSALTKRLQRAHEKISAYLEEPETENE